LKEKNLSPSGARRKKPQQTLTFDKSIKIC
jgi:hypothetical protein